MGSSSPAPTSVEQRPLVLQLRDPLLWQSGAWWERQDYDGPGSEFKAWP